MTDKNRISPDILREALLKLELNQYARTEMHLAKEDLREHLRADLREMRSAIKAERSRLVKILSTVLTVIIGGNIWAWFALEERARHALDEEVNRIRLSVQARLNEEFATPRIRALVEEKAREYTTKEAKHYITEQVELGLMPYRDQVNAAFRELQTQKATLDQYQSTAQHAASDLGQQQIALALFGGALSGSRRDYDALVRMSKGNSSAARSALESVEAINRSLDQYRKPNLVAGGIRITMPDNTGRERDLRDFSTAELLSVLQSETQGADMIRYIMGYLVSKPRPELTRLALGVLQRSQFLPGLAATCGVLLQVYGERAGFMNIDGWSRFLEEQIRANSGAPTRRQ